MERARARTTGNRPSIDVSSERPLPHSCPCFGFEVPLRTLFRPRGVSPPRRFPPLGGVQACCILLPIMGFAAFLRSGIRRFAEAIDGRPARFSTALFVPPEGFPSSAAVPCHHGRCPRVVVASRPMRVPSAPLPDPSLFALSTKFLDFEALLRG
jgi:hypothetical protein